jgi:hypothetical protein
MDNFPREAIIKKVMDNMGHDDVKAYLDREHPRHNAVVDEVTQHVERVFNSSSKPRLGLHESDDIQIRQSLHDDSRTVDDQIKDILNGHDEKWSKAYFDGGHPQHREAVKRVSILSEAKFDGALHAPEVMPLVTRSAAPNMRQDELIDGDFNSNKTTAQED